MLLRKYISENLWALIFFIIIISEGIQLEGTICN